VSQKEILMAETKATNQTNRTKSALALAINSLLEEWWSSFEDSAENFVENGKIKKFRDMRSAVHNKFYIPPLKLKRWLDENVKPQPPQWDEFCRKLTNFKVEASLIQAADAKYLAHKPARDKAGGTSAHIAAPASSAAAVAMQATSPATAQATPAALPAPTPLRFFKERSTAKAQPADPWFRLILEDAPLEAPNQLVFSIDYRPPPVPLPPKEGQPPLRFQVTLPKARVAPDWGVVTSVKDGIHKSPADPEVIYAMGWTVTLPQQVNGLALDHFVAASLQARAPGDKLTLTVFAERESIGVTRLDGGRTNGNREAVIAQALKMLGFEGKDDNVILDTGAVIAT
jgi:hypothetical protein